MSELVSIVIPVYNRASTIGRALESVLSQTYQNWEVIVVDDGSTDGTPEVIAEFAREDKRIRLICHNGNRGAQAARNTGIRAARGAWIAFLDSDDEWLRHSLEVRLEKANQEGVKVVHSDCYVVCEDGGKTIYGVPPMAGRIYRDVLIRPGPMFQSLLVKKTAIESIGYLDEEIIAYQEWDTAIRLARYYPFSFVPEPTFIYDCSGRDTISKNMLKDAIGYEEVVRKHLKAILQHAGPAALATHYQQIASRYRKAGQKQKALRYELISSLCWPFRLRGTLRRVASYLR